MEKRYSAIYQYQKKIDGVERNITKQIAFTDSLEDAKKACNNYYKEKIRTKIEDFYISVWECESWLEKHPSIPVKIEEIKNN